MALLCLMGRVVRSAGELNVLLQLMFIASTCPEIRHALMAWIATEERYAGLEFEQEPGVIEAGWGGPDGYYPARTMPHGRVVLWRHVTRFGLAVMVPVVVAPPPALPRQQSRRSEISHRVNWTRQILPLAFFRVFSPGLALEENCALFVTIS